MNKELESTVMTAVDLPTFPLVASKVIELIELDNVTLEKLTETISSDAAIAARILKLSNSSYYGCRQQIQTLSGAIMLLGFNTLKSLVIAASMKQLSSRFGLAEQMLWEHSFGAALAARIIAGNGRLVNNEAAFLVGLFHDIGKIIMNNQDSATFQTVLQRCYNEGLTFEEAERLVYPYSHAELGSLVIKKWNFPESTAHAVLYHHMFTSADCEDTYELNLTAIAGLADKFCKKLGIGERAPLEDYHLAASAEAEFLNLSNENIELLLAHLQEAYEVNKNIFLS